MTRLTCCATASMQAWDAAVVSDLKALRDPMRAFSGERDWGRFHDPESVLLALVGEVGELAELYQCLPPHRPAIWAAASRSGPGPPRKWPTCCCTSCGWLTSSAFDLADAAQAKLTTAERRHPPDTVSGSAPACE